MCGCGLSLFVATCWADLTWVCRICKWSFHWGIGTFWTMLSLLCYASHKVSKWFSQKLVLVLSCPIIQSLTTMCVGVFIYCMYIIRVFCNTIWHLYCAVSHPTIKTLRFWLLFLSVMIMTSPTGQETWAGRSSQSLWTSQPFSQIIRLSVFGNKIKQWPDS